jgi:hypothetical protein
MRITNCTHPRVRGASICTTCMVLNREFVAEQYVSKSEAVRTHAEAMGIPFIDFRLPDYDAEWNMMCDAAITMLLEGAGIPVGPLPMIDMELDEIDNPHARFVKGD